MVALEIIRQMEILPLLDLLEMITIDYQPVVEEEMPLEDLGEEKEQVMLEGFLQSKDTQVDHQTKAEAEAPEPLDSLAKVEMVEMEDHQLLINQGLQQLTLEVVEHMDILQTQLGLVELEAEEMVEIDLIVEATQPEMEAVAEEPEQMHLIIRRVEMEVMD